MTTIYRSTVTITLLDSEPFSEGSLEGIWDTLDNLLPISSVDVAYNDMTYTHPSPELTQALLDMGNDGTYFDDEDIEETPGDDL